MIGYIIIPQLKYQERSLNCPQFTRANCIVYQALWNAIKKVRNNYKEKVRKEEMLKRKKQIKNLKRGKIKEKGRHFPPSNIFLNLPF